MRDDERPLLTRKNISELAQKEEGVPLPESRIDKDAAAGVGPAPAMVYGKTHLYTRTEALRYIRSLIRPAQPDHHAAA